MKPSSAMPAYQEIIDVLRSAVSDTGLATDPADISAAALDGRGRRQGEALAVVRPASTEEVSLVMKTAAAYGLSVIRRAAGFAMSECATPEPGASRRDSTTATLILQLGHMNILNVDTVNNSHALRGRVVLQDAEGRLGCRAPFPVARRRRLMPDRRRHRRQCGRRARVAVRHGAASGARPQVATPGEVLDLMKGLRKDNSGYSLRDVFIGSRRHARRHHRSRPRARAHAPLHRLGLDHASSP